VLLSAAPSSTAFNAAHYEIEPKHHTWQQQLMSSEPHTVHQQLYNVLLRLPHLKYCRMAMPYHHMRLDASLGELKPGSTA
jgi:hypothetical protein